MRLNATKIEYKTADLSISTVHTLPGGDDHGIFSLIFLVTEPMHRTQFGKKNILKYPLYLIKLIISVICKHETVVTIHRNNVWPVRGISESMPTVMI